VTVWTVPSGFKVVVVGVVVTIPVAEAVDCTTEVAVCLTLHGRQVFTSITVPGQVPAAQIVGALPTLGVEAVPPWQAKPS
jgi:hypothetical protein